MNIQTTSFSRLSVVEISKVTSPHKKEGDSIESEIPIDYCCPITLDLMEDPVIAVDGHTYDRCAIEEWFSKGNKTSPKTSEVLTHLNLIPNYTVRSLIHEFKERELLIQQNSQSAKLEAAPVNFPDFFKERISTTSPEALEQKLTTIEKDGSDMFSGQQPYMGDSSNHQMSPNILNTRDGGVERSSSAPLIGIYREVISPVIPCALLEKLLPHQFESNLGVKELKIRYISKEKVLATESFHQEARDVFSDLQRFIEKSNPGLATNYVSSPSENILSINTQFSADSEELQEWLNEHDRITEFAKTTCINGELKITSKEKNLEVCYAKKPATTTESEVEAFCAGLFADLQQYLQETIKNTLITGYSIENSSLLIKTKFTDDAQEIQECLEEAGIRINGLTE